MILIVDASYYFYKAFYGAPEDPKGAIKTMMQAAIDCHQPGPEDWKIVALDAGRKTFRSDLFPGYKANRTAPPASFGPTVVSMKEAFRELGFTFMAAPGFEADDVIGTLCARYPDDDRIIIGKDKDLMQLVTDGVSMWNDGQWIREAEVIKKFGVVPGLVVDVLGLSGDSGDGIPGVPGIGAKIGSQLVQEFGCLEDLYGNIEFITKFFHARIAATLKQSKELAFLSRTLATIKTDVNLELRD